MTIRTFQAENHAPGSYGFQGKCAYCGAQGREAQATHQRTLKNGRVVACCATHAGVSKPKVTRESR
jgi:hypothetical protein